MAATSAIVPASLIYKAYSTAISSNGFIDYLSPLSSTPVLAVFTRTLIA